MNEVVYLILVYGVASLLAVGTGIYISKSQYSEGIRKFVVSIVRYLVLISPLIIGAGLGLLIAVGASSFGCYKQECSAVEQNALSIFPPLITLISIPFLLISRKLARKVQSELLRMNLKLWRTGGLTISALGVLGGLGAIILQLNYYL